MIWLVIALLMNAGIEPDVHVHVSDSDGDSVHDIANGMDRCMATAMQLLR